MTREVAQVMRLVSVFGLALVACLPTPAPAPPVDGEATPEGACANLERLECPEAEPATNGVTCPEVLRKMARLLDPKLACVAHAGDIAAVRACGTVRCRP